MGESSDLGCCANTIRAVLIIINIVFGALGIAVFGIGIWAVVENQDFEFITGSAIASGGAIFIVAGIVSMVVCVIGILGAIFKARPLLVIYAVLVVLIVILEIVAAIVAFVFRDDLLEGIEERSLEAIRLYRVGEDTEGFRSDVNSAVDSIQSLFDCCGFNNASDWFIENPDAIMANGEVPPSCPMCTVGEDDPDCRTFSNATVGVSFNVTSQGCGDFSSDRFTVFAYSVGGVGIAFAILEIVGVLFALFLCCCITSARKQEVV